MTSESVPMEPQEWKTVFDLHQTELVNLQKEYETEMNEIERNRNLDRQYFNDLITKLQARLGAWPLKQHRKEQLIKEHLKQLKKQDRIIRTQQQEIRRLNTLNRIMSNMMAWYKRREMAKASSHLITVSQPTQPSRTPRSIKKEMVMKLDTLVRLTGQLDLKSEPEIIDDTQIRRLQNETVEAEELSRVLEEQHEALKALLHSTAEDLRCQLDKERAKNQMLCRSLKRVQHRIASQRRRFQQCRTPRRTHAARQKLQIQHSFSISRKEFITTIGRNLQQAWL